MPSKGTKKKRATGRTKPVICLTPQQAVVDILSEVAFDQGFKNPRTRKLSLTQAVEHVALAYQANSYLCLGNMSFFNSLCAYLLKRVAVGDKEAQEHLNCIKSWEVERNKKEAIAENAINVSNKTTKSEEHKYNREQKATTRG